MDSVPGIGPQTAQQIIAKIGPDMTRFQSEAHLASWAGMAPGQNEIAGKKTAWTSNGNNIYEVPLLKRLRVPFGRKIAICCKV